MNKSQIDSIPLDSYDQSLNNLPDDLQLILDRLPGVSYRCLPCFPWQMEFVSAGCEAVIGYDSALLVSQDINWGELVHPDDLDHLKQSLRHAVRKNEPFEVEYRITTRSGVEKWVWDRGYAVCTGNDNRLVLDGFITDITDRKTAEIDLLRAQAYSRAIVDTAIEAIISISDEGCIETVNAAAQTIFGYQPEDLKGLNFRVLLSTPSQGVYTACLEQCMSESETTCSCHTRDLFGQKKDGSQFPMQVSVSEVRNQYKRTFIWLIRDMTLQRKAEDEAKEHREKLARVDRLNSLGEMASGIAHEINQPLTAISLFSQVCKRFIDSQQYDRLPEMLDKLTAQAQRAGDIVERMQNMSRQHDSVREKMNCNEMVKEIVCLAEAESWIRKIPIALELDENMPAVLADKVQIQQVVLNLLRNGMESMVAANCKLGEAIRLVTRVNDNDYVEVMVVDSGLGVDSDVEGLVFKPFSTTKQEGMGMGLSISRAIVTAHGGQLSFRNNATTGATFTFTLPSE